MSLFSAGMDARYHNGTPGRENTVRDWGENAAETLARRIPSSEPRRPRGPGWDSTIRTVTPESIEVPDDNLSMLETPPRIFQSVQTSPRSIPGGEKPKERRQGLVFNDSYSSDSIDKPPQSTMSLRSRPRTYTVDATTRKRSGSRGAPRNRQRIGSIHSTNSSSFHDIEPRADANTAAGYLPTFNRNTLTKSNSLEKEKGNGRRLVKKHTRPTSPFQAFVDIPTIDSLAEPVSTGDAKKILGLMKSLRGSMRGEVEYQTVERGRWYKGVCYIDDAKGSLMHEDDDKGPFHIAVATDLRGCRVRPIMYLLERQVRCLEISNPSLGLDLRLLPTNPLEFDSWLAAILPWQQIRLSGSFPAPLKTPIGNHDDRRPTKDRRGSEYSNKDSNIIKVAKLLLWDKGPSLSPDSIITRRSTRHLRNSGQQWRRISCILQDNGALKLLTENDAVLLSVVQLPQLSRSAIQKLDKSVLGEEYCVAIFPQYTSNSTDLSIFRPIYLALETRLVFEVWLCLLRAFTIPEIYGPDTLQQIEEHDENKDLPGGYSPTTTDMFRIEKSLSMRIVEAKFRKPGTRPEVPQYGRHSVRPEPEGILGDYFAEVMLDCEVRARTVTKFETRNPFWREECEFTDLPPHLPKLSIVLKRMEMSQLTVQGFLSSSSVQATEQQVEIICGVIDIPFDKLERGKDNEAWWPILDQNQDPVGEMLMKVRHDEVVVLLAKDYQPISELLHNFNNGLTLQISQVIPNSLRQLSEVLINIFQVSGNGSEWLKALVEDEIDGIGKEAPTKRLRYSRRIGSNEMSFMSVDREQSVRDMGKSLNTEANLLFRGNSLLTQALDFHMRRVGKEYLSEILGEQIRTINNINPDCEVDPSRIDSASSFDRNWVSLIALTTDVWRSIADSATRCPPELRQVFKYIRAVAEDRYGDFLRTVAYTSVSGFIFLRFFCPAILNPKLFGLLPDHPQQKAQRTFTLIAKSLQALANLSSFGQKESWMEPMNKFLHQHRQGVKDFLDSICAIAPDRTTFAMPASYSTPITILSRLPPTSREGFPSLPYLIDHSRSFADLVKLWLEGTSKSMPHYFEGDLAEFNDLCIALKKRTDECILKAEDYGDRVADQASLQLEDIVEGLQSTHIQESPQLNALPPPQSQLQPEPEPEPEPEQQDPVLTPPWHDYSLTNSNATSINNTSQTLLPAPGSAGSGSEKTGATSSSKEKEKEKKEKQNFWEATFGKDSKYQRPYAPAPPLDHSAQQLGTQASSPPGDKRGLAGFGINRQEKQSRSFLGGLRRKGKHEPKSQGSGSSNDGGFVMAPAIPGSSGAGTATVTAMSVDTSGGGNGNGNARGGGADNLRDEIVSPTMGSHMSREGPGPGPGPGQGGMF
ncbi:GTPase activating factor [Ciborinia camelliae]|nr:GTPase activating factor [Ciborinia camelliae]